MRTLIVALVAMFGFMGTAQAVEVNNIWFNDYYFTQTGTDTGVAMSTTVHGIPVTFTYNEVDNYWSYMTETNVVYPRDWSAVASLVNVTTETVKAEDRALLETLHTNLRNLREEVTWIPLNDHTDFDRLDETVARIKTHVGQISDTLTRING